MAGAMGRFLYTSDDGNSYSLKLDAGNAGVFGAAAAPAGTPGRPSGMVPRYVLARLPTGRVRKLICPAPAHAVWLGTDSEIDLPDFDTMTAAATAGVTARIGEKRTSR